VLVRVGRVEEFPEKRPLIKLAGARPVAVVRIGERLFAFDAFCPHSRWNLGASGMAFCNNGHCYVVCKGHWGRWSLDTGEGVVQGHPAPPLRVYRAVVGEDGFVYVELGEESAAPFLTKVL